MSAKERILEIIDTETRRFEKSIAAMERGHVTTHTNGVDDTQKTIEEYRVAIANLQNAKTLLATS